MDEGEGDGEEVRGVAGAEAGTEIEVVPEMKMKGPLRTPRE
jgi:hypothetical protein